LQRPIVDVCGVEVFPYIGWDFAYHIHQYLLKNFKPRNPTLEMDKIWFNWSMNQGHVFIENSFGILKNCWKILQSLIVKIDNGPPLLWHVVISTTIVNWWASIPWIRSCGKNARYEKLGASKLHPLLLGRWSCKGS